MRTNPSIPRLTPSPLTVLRVTLALAAGVLVSAGAVSAQTNLNLVHAFASENGPAHPSGPLIQATDGNFYGTTFSGGASGFGTVFKMTPDGTTYISQLWGLGGDLRCSATSTETARRTSRRIVPRTAAGTSCNRVRTTPRLQATCGVCRATSRCSKAHRRVRPHGKPGGETRLPRAPVPMREGRQTRV
jgi:uncharacterized repeat protein (TIGR03803 family)